MNWRSKIDQIWISLRFKLVLISSKWVVTTWFTNMIWHGTTATADIVGRDLGSRSSPGEGGNPRTTQILSLGHGDWGGLTLTAIYRTINYGTLLLVGIYKN